MKEFTHISDNSPTMVDVSAKNITTRTAIAKSEVLLPEDMAAHIKDGEIQTLKGPVFHTAVIAGIQAAKKTYELIPLCHNLPITKVDIRIRMIEELKIGIECEVKCDGKTGVEMEALTGASLAALTIYDMCKAFSHHIVISDTRLAMKTGGKSDFSAK